MRFMKGITYSIINVAVTKLKISKETTKPIIQIIMHIQVKTTLATKTPPDFKVNKAPDDQDLCIFYCRMYALPVSREGYHHSSL